MKASTVSVDRIIVPEYVERPYAKIQDARDKASIEAHGIQQALVLVPDGERLILAKGLRRLRIAKALGMGKVPYVTASVPEGMPVDDYVRELRLALSEHREDLRPSQKMNLVEELKRRFKMSSKEIAHYLGVDEDTIVNWRSLRKYIQPVVAAIDADLLTMGAARAFDGMTPEGQEEIWQRHHAELCGKGNTGAHKLIRKLYPAEKYPSYYSNPELSAKRIAAKAGRSRSRAALPTEEKRRLLNSVEMRMVELSEGKRDYEKMKREITAAIPIVAAIMRNDDLRALVPEETRVELERFSEIYVS